MQKQAPEGYSTSSTVAVIGLGKIGLPLAVQYARHGRRVIGCDINPEVVEMVNSGHARVQEEHLAAAEIAELVERGFLSATLDISEAVRQAGVVVVIVPLIVDARHRVDFAGIDAVTAALGAHLQPGTLVIYETTLPVGTTAGRLRQILEQASPLRAGQDFFLAYSPERVSSGNIFRDLSIYPKIVGGLDEQSKNAAVRFYRSVLDAEIITMRSTDEAEFVKLIETTYRDVNIALANEFACYADAHGINVAEAITAANSQPYSHIHQPGVGVGGHCIPVYPYFLFAENESAPAHTRLSAPPMLTLPRFARLINDAMAEYAVCRVEAAVGSLAHQVVLILGVAYRGDVHGAAFTSANLLQQALREREARVYVDDPLFSAEELRELGYMPLIPECEGDVQAIIVQAAHRAYQEFDFSRFARCQVVFDGRRALRREQIQSPGMHYMSIGDGGQGEFVGTRLSASGVEDLQAGTDVIKRVPTKAHYDSRTKARMRFASIVGARPQFVKLAAVSRALRQPHQELIIHTGQHYDYALSAQFFAELAIPEPDYHLGVGSGTHGVQTGRMLEAIEQVLLKERPDWVVVYGDTNSTLAGALAAAKLHIPVAHVEAGLRSFNYAMPEEINRVVTDHLAERLFCPTETARANVSREGITRGVEVVGDVMYDVLLQSRPQIDDHARALLPELGVTARNYALVTVHRAANTDDPVAMHSIAAALNRLEMPVIFPVHPRTRACLQRYDIVWRDHVRLIEPVGYFDMLALEREAYRILTDSGGVQKEAFFLGVPCITLRAETEWVETVQAGWNIVAGIHMQDILHAVQRPEPEAIMQKPFGDGNAALRIAQSWYMKIS